MRTARFLALSSVACLAAVFMATAADAQQQDGDNAGRQRGGQQRGGFGGPGGAFGGGFGGPGGPGGFNIDRATLLGAESVKEELQISDAQSVTLTAAIDAYRQERNESRPDRSAFENLSDEERQAMFQKMQKDREALSRKTDELLNAMLEPEQVKRLDEISLQSRLRGGMIAAIKSDELKSALSITEEQIKGLEEIEESVREAQEKMREEMRANFQRGRGDGGNGRGDGGNRPDFTQMRERAEAARKETETKVLAVLTDSQKSKLEEMKGKPFELDPRELMSGRGGFGGPGGQGGRGRDNWQGQGQGNDNGGGRRRPAAESDSI